MNYRLIVRYDTTGEVTSQLYSSPFEVDMITSYLDRALENGGQPGISGAGAEPLNRRSSYH